MAKKKAVVQKNPPILEELKGDYAKLDSSLNALLTSAAEVYWKQGRVLSRMKTIVGHGGWIPWIEENLSIGEEAARRRMAIGELHHLPKASLGRDLEFGIKELAAISGIAKDEKITPDAAAKQYLLTQQEAPEPKEKPEAAANKDDDDDDEDDEEDDETQKERERAHAKAERVGAKRMAQEEKSERGPTHKAGMTPAAAFAILGIDTTNETIAKESLDILAKGLKQKHHPDKGGNGVKFKTIMKAIEVLS